MNRDLRPEFDLLQQSLLLVLLGLVIALVQLIQKLAVIHHPADRGLGLRGDFDEVESALAGNDQRLGGGHDAERLLVLVDHPDFPVGDQLVRPVQSLLDRRRRWVSSKDGRPPSMSSI